MKNFRCGRNLTLLATLGTLAFATGCSDDDEDEGGGGTAATAGSAGNGSGGSSSGGTAGKGGSSTGGSSTGGTAGKGGSSSGGTGGNGDDLARVRVLHLSPDAPGVDVFANGADEPVVENLEFPDGTAYLDVPAGAYTFDIAPTGTSADDAVLTVADLELEAGSSYTAVAFDELASISALALVDDAEGLDAGDIRIRAIHTAVGVGQVDIWNVTNPGSPSALYEDVDFGVAADAIDLPEGAYTIGVDVDDDMMPDLTFALPELAAGTVVNVFATNDEDGNVFLLAQLADGVTVRIDPE